jgi:polyhydroxyalkanoate synthesis regulator phasin
MATTRNKKKIITAGLVAGLIAGAGAGLVLELSGTAGADQSVAAATVPGETDDAAGDMEADHAARLQEVLQPLVDDGTITQAQADAVIAALQAAHPMRGEGVGRRAFLLAAETIGISPEELRTAVMGGQTIAEVAAANGSSGDAVIAALVAKAQEHIDGDVAEGEYTAEEGAEKLAAATARITEFVNNTPELPMRHGRHGHHGDMDGDMDGDMGGDDLGA